VKDIYAPFTDEEISAKISQMLTSTDIKAEVQIVFKASRICTKHARTIRATGISLATTPLQAETGW